MNMLRPTCYTHSHPDDVVVAGVPALVDEVELLLLVGMADVSWQVLLYLLSLLHCLLGRLPHLAFNGRYTCVRTSLAGHGGGA